MRRLLLPAVAALLLTAAACSSRPAPEPVPDVAKQCDAVADTTPTAAPAATQGGGPVPENPKYLENRAFKSTLPLTARARCRGEAHAARLVAALPEDGAAAGVAAVLGTVETLGYPKENVEVRLDPAPGLVALVVPGTGPCVTVRLGPKPTAEVHGVYLEGGCVEPEGGH